MKKRILLLLLALNMLNIRAMDEKESFVHCFLVLRSYVPAWLKSKNPSPMQYLEESKKKFESQLQKNLWSSSLMDSIAVGMFVRTRHYDDPFEFLKYCYNHDLDCNERLAFAVSIDDLSILLLDKCKEVRIDGYSALSAAILAKNIPENKSIFIQELVQKGFMLTADDRKLIALELYSIIPVEQKEIMIFLLQDHKEGNLSLLPYDVRKCMVDYMVQLNYMELSEEKNGFISCVSKFACK